MSLLLERRVYIDLAREFGAPPPRGWDKSYQKKAHLPATGSQVVYLGNLSFSIEEDDVKDFFKDVGEITQIRFQMKDGRFMGFGHVDFTTAEAAEEIYDNGGFLFARKSSNLKSNATKVVEIVLEMNLHCEACGKDIKHCLRKSKVTVLLLSEVEGSMLIL